MLENAVIEKADKETFPAVPVLAFSSRNSFAYGGGALNKYSFVAKNPAAGRNGNRPKRESNRWRVNFDCTNTSLNPQAYYSIRRVLGSLLNPANNSLAPDGLFSFHAGILPTVKTEICSDLGGWLS